MEKEKLPDDWEWTKLSDAAILIMGQSPPGTTYNKCGEGMPFLQGKAEFGAIFPCHVKYTTQPMKIAPKNTMLISVRAPVGDVNIANHDYCIGRGLASIALHKGETKYLFYLLKHLKPKIEKKGTGSTFKSISKALLSDLIIPLPPLEIQREIVDKLDRQMGQIEVLKKENENVASAVDFLLESSINYEMKINNTSLSDSWIKYELQDICHLKTGGTPSKNHPEYFDGKIKWMVSGDINKEFIYDVDGRITQIGYENSNARYLPINSVLIALNGQGKTRGTVAILKTEATCNQSIIALIPKDDKIINYSYLFYYLKGCYQKLRNLTGDNERSGLSMRVLKPFSILVPPIQIQKRIVENLKKTHEVYMNINNMVDAQQDSINQLPESILNEVFGKYELPDEV